MLKEPGLRLPAAISRLERRSCPAGRCPNSSSLHPPQAAVVAVANHMDDFQQQKEMTASLPQPAVILFDLMPEGR